MRGEERGYGRHVEFFLRVRTRGQVVDEGVERLTLLRKISSSRRSIVRLSRGLT